jgi:hypothetical protein
MSNQWRTLFNELARFPALAGRVYSSPRRVFVGGMSNVSYLALGAFLMLNRLMLNPLLNHRPGLEPQCRCCHACPILISGPKI